ncbi:hypothetical protein [Winogradskyella helgolandensis]|uniref:hypothetical protein n=1 Tax=Winogradskyella helgolandensis TaxID=2697010 RepID=UPI0015CCA6E1|nr:hypothetical protein [Winogradskyella helgolandensis]
MKIILPIMYFTSGFSSLSTLDYKLSVDSYSVTKQKVVTKCSRPALINTMKAFYLNKKHTITENYLQLLYIYKTFSTYITQNHILKQS